MQSKRARLDRFLSVRVGVNRKDVRLMLAEGRVCVDGELASDIAQQIDQFSRISLDNQLLQANAPRYVMMNKPVGVVSATRDERHKTVIDLLADDNAASLHIVGRLDFNSSGLLLLTNDGRWSRHLTSPDKKITKLYRVSLGKPVTREYIDAFAKGMHFPYEDIITRPAKLEIINDYEAQVSLVEGRYHQIKRMFGRFANPVLTLHRMAIGSLALDPELAPGESRELTPWEVDTIASKEAVAL